MGSHPGRRAAGAIVVLASLVGIAAPPALAKKGAGLEIHPGPGAITAEERAIEPDPASGAEHAVLLVEETQRNDNLITESERAYHLRAKILSNEGRELADVQIPFLSGAKLKEWWGRTILPDGRALELRREELKEQSVVKASGLELRALKGALPGVVPGCVIDYGYVLRSGQLLADESVLLQKQWPVRDLRYHWIPSEYLRGGFRLAHSEGRDVQVTRDGRTFGLVARNLPPVVEEPWMPPQREVRANVTLYYLSTTADPKRFWETETLWYERLIAAFLRKDKPLKQALKAVGLPAEADFRTKLGLVYDWIGGNIKHATLQSSEEMEASERKVEDEAWTAGMLLERGEGTDFQLDALFIGFARLLGAEAHLVLATDRTDHYFDPGLMSLRQFDVTFVAVRSPGEPDSAAVIADPGSGLGFGEVPWWATGTLGLLVAPEGGRPILLQPSAPGRNVSTTEASIRFSDDNERILVEWTRMGQGAQGFDERRRLRSLSPVDRVKRLDELCGAKGDTEVLEASTPGIEHPVGPFRLTCRTEATGTHLEPETGRYAFLWSGSWLEEAPELPSKSRIHPLVFRYPRTDVLSLEVSAPAGFAPAEPPPPVETQSPFGVYKLSVRTTETGYRLERLFVLKALSVPPEEYEPLRRFLAEATQADRTSLVFRRTEAAE